MTGRLAIDLFCGLGGWTEGLLAEGYRVVGFDIEQHVYGEARYPAQLVLQDVLTIHGRQFKDAALIVASPPCQEYSYMAMPWSRAKEKIRKLENGEDDPKRLTALFDACFRIQREASEAAGHHIPMVVENVRGAQKWVGKARWHFGSFYLWGDVPALMPITSRKGMKGSVGTINGSGKHREQSSWDRGDKLLEATGVKVNGFRFDGSGKSFQSEAVKVATMGAGWYPPDHPKHVPGLEFNSHAERGLKVASQQGRRTDVGNGARFTSRDCGVENTIANAADGCNQGGGWFGSGADRSLQRKAGSKSSKRKAASAHIAKIPLVLSRHIARAWRDK